LAEVVCALTFLKLVNIQRGPLATSTDGTVNYGNTETCSLSNEIQNEAKYKQSSLTL